MKNKGQPRKGNEMKICEMCGDEISTKDGEGLCEACEDAQDCGRKTRRGGRSNRRMVDSVMADLGMVKVRGALGGTYYE